MNHVKNIVQQIVKSSCPQTSWKYKLMQNWQEIMGPLSHRICIEKIQKDCIILGVSDSCLMQELHMLSDVIKKKINESFDISYIKNVQFKYSSQKMPRVQKIKNNIPLLHESKALTQSEKEALAHIKDPELSQALMRFLQKCHQS